MEKKEIGVIGLAVMGENISLNIESRGFSVAVYNLEKEMTEDFINSKAQGKSIVPAYSLEELVNTLKRPRKIWMMIKAGSPVDQTIDALLPYLDKGDVLIDGGNSDFRDTEKREMKLEKHGIHYIGMGVSGGAKGALNGPSLMPGGSREGYKLVEQILNGVAANVNGEPCCTYIGPGGAGHFVKAVHNGIEYSDMQLITEAYMILEQVLGMDASDLHKTFSEWNKGDLESYLIEITAEIFKKNDPDTGKPLIDMILDAAGQKGTGKWTVQLALDLGVPIPTIAEAVFARIISSFKEERVKASSILTGPPLQHNGNSKSFKYDVRDALSASKICSYAQGFFLMREASREYEWDLNPAEIARIWRGGCIIRARLLDKIQHAFKSLPDLDNLLLDPQLRKSLENSQPAWRKTLTKAMESGIPVPGLASALSFFDSYRREQLGANLIQAQRDFFGAHTYQRKDKDGVFHTEWE
ncbi:NADP-dependent phosphogluconate dehydrogenase [Natronogracilivirga saccharolytica]|uniref:6-phosphogluconate dehydrogenase, decarboxylating n=1 Tax=Natronogracilivirga saccharolytica TaxID=2812953 RepID=A0A8J7UWQ1_9BACT|nr:NADP-dependent phosphogluconate dehydrogenase [Natronogracilivirga saccharolytica]MBP3193877.1 NADP-dependent phosphogluconate dehydrogenase [Natronogracilivirga saccharolytica]